MSSADPTDVGSSTSASGDNLRRGRSSEKRPINTSDPVLREENDVKSEKPQANPEAKPESRETERKPPESDPTQGGIKGGRRWSRSAVLTTEPGETELCLSKGIPEPRHVAGNRQA
jgi:membrane fusion protein, multidrug efflux system